MNRIKSILRYCYSRPKRLVAVIVILWFGVSAFHYVTGRLFFDAIMHGNFDRVKQIALINPLVINADGYGGRGTALQFAVYYDRVDMVEYLIDKKCNMLAGNRREGAPFQYASYYGKVEIVKILLENKIDIDVQLGDLKSGLQGTALHNAAAGGSVEVVRLLLKNHADPNSVAPLKFSSTPLHLASRSNSNLENKAEVVRLLIAYGADVNAVDAHGKTPYENALQFVSTWGIDNMDEVLKVFEEEMQKVE